MVWLGVSEFLALTEANGVMQTVYTGSWPAFQFSEEPSLKLCGTFWGLQKTGDHTNLWKKISELEAYLQLYCTLK